MLKVSEMLPREKQRLRTSLDAYKSEGYERPLFIEGEWKEKKQWLELLAELNKEG